MRNNLGRVILAILIFFQLNIFASTYRWSAEADKSLAVTNEAIYLKYVCEYSDATELYVIEFNPVIDNEKYKIEMLSESEKIVDGKKINLFEFVAFIKHPGTQEFIFDTTMKKTNKDSIQNTVLGRDNADYEEFSQRFIRQEIISVDVKDSGSDLVGEFVLKVKKDKEKLKAYEPYHLEIIIKGRGNFETLKPISFNIEGVKVFSQKIIEDIRLTKDGHRGRWSQKFAFVSEKNFTIPKVEINYYDLKDKVIKKLVVSQTKVEVSKAYKKEELLDVEEKKFLFSFDFLYYALTFLAGYLVAKVKFRQNRKTDAKDGGFEAKIKNVKSLEEFMMILALKDSKKYEKLISKIEIKEITSIKDAKKQLINE